MTSDSEARPKASAADRAADLALIEQMENIAGACWATTEVNARKLEHLCALARAGLDAPPREPTQEMFRAGDVAWGEADHNDYVAMCGVIYRAMHDAWTGREHD